MIAVKTNILTACILLAACRVPGGMPDSASYRPGLGEFMKSLQYHHAKLYYAGQNRNWRLAEFELHELTEAAEDIEKFHPGRAEIQTLAALKKSFTAVKKTVETKDQPAFQTAFDNLTKTCNACHRETNHDFISITAPVAPPVTNQDFRPTPGR